MNSLHQHNWSPKASTNTSMILWLPGGLAQHLVLLEFISIYSWLPWVYYYYHPPAASSIHLAAIVVSSPLTTSTAHDLTLFGWCWFLSISLLWAGPAVVLLKTEVLTFLLLLTTLCCSCCSSTCSFMVPLLSADISQHSKSLVLIILLLADNTCWTLAIKHSSLYSFTELADCHCATFKHLFLLLISCTKPTTTSKPSPPPAIIYTQPFKEVHCFLPHNKSHWPWSYCSFLTRASLPSQASTSRHWAERPNYWMINTNGHFSPPVRVLWGRSTCWLGGQHCSPAGVITSKSKVAGVTRNYHSSSHSKESCCLCSRQHYL